MVGASAFQRVITDQCNQITAGSQFGIQIEYSFTDQLLINTTINLSLEQVLPTLVFASALEAMVGLFLASLLVWVVFSEGITGGQV